MKILGVHVDMQAAKAYIGGIAMTSQELVANANGQGGLATRIWQGVEVVSAHDFPPVVDSIATYALAWGIGYLAVYFTPNAQPKKGIY